jgi:ABC-2 type transport system ATP-binding protein
VAETVGAIEGVERVNETHVEASGRKIVTLTAASQRDLRPVIFELAKSRGWTLYELHQESRSLEDVFQELTADEG